MLKIKPLQEYGKATSKIIEHFSHYISIFKIPPRKFRLFSEINITES